MCWSSNEINNPFMVKVSLRHYRKPLKHSSLVMFSHDSNTYQSAWSRGSNFLETSGVDPIKLNASCPQRSKIVPTRQDT